jgi:hypothetical protein
MVVPSTAMAPSHSRYRRCLPPVHELLGRTIPQGAVRPHFVYNLVASEKASLIPIIAVPELLLELCCKGLVSPLPLLGRRYPRWK